MMTVLNTKVVTIFLLIHTMTESAYFLNILSYVNRQLFEELGLVYLRYLISNQHRPAMTENEIHSIHCKSTYKNVWTNVRIARQLTVQPKLYQLPTPVMM